MGMNWNDLPYKHEKDCTNRDSNDIEKRDVKYDCDADGEYEYHYDAYCPVCGVHLYTFDCGHYEMY